MGRAATLRVDITADAKGVDRGVARADSKLGKLGAGARKVGKAVGLGLAVAGVAAVKLGKDSLDAASRVQQATGAIQTVFGKHAKAVKRWARSAADDVGLAKSEYMELSSVVGSQLQNMGLSQEKSAGRSRKLIKLGADLAATYGGTVSDAVAAVSSLLRGEADPIERYGVGIKQADIQARLAAQGLDKLEGNAGKTAKTQATLALLTEQTSKAQGAFSRESNTYAGQQERLRAKLENVKATIGRGLLPIATKLTGWISKRGLPGAMKLGRSLAKHLGPAFRTVGRFITQHVIPAARRFQQWFMDKIAPGIRRYLTPVIDGAKRAFERVRAAIKRNEPELKQIGNLIRRVAEFTARHILPALGRLVGFLYGQFGRAMGGAINTVGNIVRAFNGVVGAVRSLIGWLGRLKWPKPPGWLRDVGGAVGGLFAADVTALRPQLAGTRRGTLAPDQGVTRAAWSDGLGWLGDGGQVAAARSGGMQIVTIVKVDARGSIGLDGDDLARVVERAMKRRARRQGAR
jgi:hypothetical protein